MVRRPLGSRVFRAESMPGGCTIERPIAAFNERSAPQGPPAWLHTLHGAWLPGSLWHRGAEYEPLPRLPVCAAAVTLRLGARG
eukprot:COSAG01_NODE_10_length_42970_cov_93.010007_8_plen_83_part_00